MDRPERRRDSGARTLLIAAVRADPSGPLSGDDAPVCGQPAVASSPIRIALAPQPGGRSCPHQCLPADPGGETAAKFLISCEPEHAQ